ncbi:amidohydrolase [Pseudoteredinibacter isoporae]|uniref:Hippurate hydrolase n=1 Tax=Pseudoteredinibacter isoporae TaxID=570281 RepID=A0A7X0JTI7_9GAMM|nr:amidohydrolase [Pseudoteredinibacter isoporae]MBB6521126.1 hippurate hydrolase [Pseudoteredinibacter isoporae]NHO86687.1 amidohydrolase [Pseudoteredinibacter isoporae]NIB24861.1 amidohydrolase [Pseudoteredinibacter isoporae]
MKINKPVLDTQSVVTEWRRHIHAHPETAFEEHQTAAMVARILRELGMEVEEGIGGTGVVGTLKAGTSNRRLGLRADMDALFIHELNELDYRSQVDGKMHACGHDGHTAILLGAAKVLAENPNFDGIIHFIFQPAEETGDEHCGGNAMVKDGLFERYPAESIFALHNMPGLPFGYVAMRSGPMLASIDTFEFKMLSENTHAAAQHSTADPVLAAAQAISACHQFKARYINPADALILTITQVKAGDPLNDRPGVHVGPSEVLVRGTIYTLNEDIRSDVEAGLAKTIKHTAELHGTDYEFSYEYGYPVLQNSPAETQLAAKAATRVVGEENVDADMHPVMGAEDFAFMLKAKPGCYIMLGADGGESGYLPCQLHNPHYDFNDDLIPIGIQYFLNVVDEFFESE